MREGVRWTEFPSCRNGGNEEGGEGSFCLEPPPPVCIASLCPLTGHSGSAPCLASPPLPLPVQPGANNNQQRQQQQKTTSSSNNNSKKTTSSSNNNSGKTTSNNEKNIKTTTRKRRHQREDCERNLVAISLMEPESAPIDAPIVALWLTSTPHAAAMTTRHLTVAPLKRRASHYACN